MFSDSFLLPSSCPPWRMDDRPLPIASSPLSVPAAVSQVIANCYAAEDSADAIPHEEIEVWLNEGGAGDEPGP